MKTAAPFSAFTAVNRFKCRIDSQCSILGIIWLSLLSVFWLVSQSRVTRSCVPNFLRLRFLEFQTIFRSHTFLALIFVSSLWIVSKSQSFQTLLFERKFPPYLDKYNFFVRLHLVCHPHESLTFLRLLSKPAIPLLCNCYWVTKPGVERCLEKFSQNWVSST